LNAELTSTDMIDVLTEPFVLLGPPALVRSDNGPEFVAKDARAWIGADPAKTLLMGRCFGDWHQIAA
jgi:hypothetical protein